MNNKSIVALLIIAGIVLIGCVAYVIIILNEEDIETEEGIEEIIVDQRISPYLNQGLTVEVHRMRNRELMDKMLQFGRSWRNKPTFYWIAIVDGKEHNLDTIEAAGQP